MDLCGAGGAREALALVEASSFDLVISDVDMPEMDGFALMGEAHQRAPDLPFILMSGTPDPSLAERARAHGARACLPKPFSLDRLDALRLLTERRLASDPSAKVLRY